MPVAPGNRRGAYRNTQPYHEKTRYREIAGFFVPDAAGLPASVLLAHVVHVALFGF